jgi:uncharacterized membrane protein YcaP (DUF421 family)
MAYLNTWLTTVFGGDQPPSDLLLTQAAARAALVYLMGLAMVRLGKSRLIGSLSAIDILLAVVLGSLLSRGINGSASMSSSLVASAVLVAMHWLMTDLACRSHRLGDLIKGHAQLLVENGRINWPAMQHSHLSEHDLIEELRLNANVEGVDEIEKAYKERNGRISGVRGKQQLTTYEISIENGVKTVRIEVLTHS